MSFLKEAIDRLVQIGTDDQSGKTVAVYDRDGGDAQYWAATRKPVIPKAVPAALGVRTLQGLIDYTTHLRRSDGPFTDPQLFVHATWKDASLQTVLDDDADRLVFVVAQHTPVTFPYGQWMDPETFIIHMRNSFDYDLGDAAAVISLAGGVRSTSTAEQQDDGVSQTVTVKRGAAMISTEETKGVYKLHPWRTFTEVGAIEQDTVFRVRTATETEGAKCALFVADGDAWQEAATRAVVDWLRKHLIPAIPVIG